MVYYSNKAFTSSSVRTLSYTVKLFIVPFQYLPLTSLEFLYAPNNIVLLKVFVPIVPFIVFMDAVNPSTLYLIPIALEPDVTLIQIFCSYVYYLT